MAYELTASITESPDGDFYVREHNQRGWTNSIRVPRSVMLTFLGEFSEKVLQLRLDAMKEAQAVRDRLEVTRALPPHTRLCGDGHCYCPSKS